MLLWEWANEAGTRRESFTSTTIPWEEHVKWFRSKLNKPDCVFFIATIGPGIPIAQIRYELEGRDAVVSISVDRNNRHKGYGSMIISLSAQELFGTTSIIAIHAYVKRGNEASVRAFEKAGYRYVDLTAIGGEDAVHLTLTRSLKHVG